MLLSWGVPPATSGSAIIVANLARQFSTEEMIIVGEKPVGRPPYRWESRWPRIVYAIRGWPPGRRGARWIRWLQLPLLFLRCLTIAHMYRVEAIVTVFPKEDFLFVGYLTACFTRARFFPYFHNTYLENRAGLALAFARWFQRRVFAKAERL